MHFDSLVMDPRAISEIQTRNWGTSVMMLTPRGGADMDEMNATANSEPQKLAEPPEVPEAQEAAAEPQEVAEPQEAAEPQEITEPQATSARPEENNP
jgi:hypothetical protein